MTEVGVCTDDRSWGCTDDRSWGCSGVGQRTEVGVWRRNAGACLTHGCLVATVSSGISAATETAGVEAT